MGGRPQCGIGRERCARGLQLFATTSFWRDLIAFTWNLKTVENPEGIADMLTATLPHLDAVHFTIAEEPTEADGIVTAWLSLETAMGG
jgi:putative flavoprotein involved in K+ transport